MNSKLQHMSGILLGIAKDLDQLVNATESDQSEVDSVIGYPIHWSMEDVRKAHICRALAETDTVTDACRLLQVSDRTIYRSLSSWGMSLEEARELGGHVYRATEYDQETT